MNTVTMIGNLASDPDLRYTQSGKAVVEFRLAVDRRGGEDADFFTIKAWDRFAETQAEYLASGRRVAITGRLSQERWETEDGDPRSKVVIVASEIDWIDGPKTADPVENEGGGQA